MNFLSFDCSDNPQNEDKIQHTDLTLAQQSTTRQERPAAILQAITDGLTGSEANIQN